MSHHNRQVHELPDDFELEFVAAGDSHSVEEDTFLRASDELLCLNVRNYTGQIIVRRKDALLDQTTASNTSPGGVNSSFQTFRTALPNRSMASSMLDVSDFASADEFPDSASDQEDLLQQALENHNDVENSIINNTEEEDPQNSSSDFPVERTAQQPKLVPMKTEDGPTTRASTSEVATITTTATAITALSSPTSTANNTPNALIRHPAAAAATNLLPLLVQLKLKIPKHIQRAREIQRKTFGTSMPQLHQKQHNPTVLPPTRLHSLCAETTVTWSELERTLEQDPNACSVLDGKGRTPLHILADNDALFFDRPGKFVVTNFLRSLIQAYPPAITTVDAAGRMPFVSLLEDWCLWVYEKHEEDSKKRKQQLQHNRRTATAAAFRNPNRVLERVAEQINDRVDTLWTGSQDNRSLTGESDGGGGGGGLASPNLHAKASRLYPRAEVWEEVEFSLEMLSLVMDELGGKNGGLFPVEESTASLCHNTRDKQARNELATHIIHAIPSLIKTVLLIDSEGGEVRRQLLELSIFRRLLLCPESVGPWLINMLRRKGVPAKRAVDYLEMVSKTTCEDYVGVYRTALADDVEEFEKAKEQVFEAMERLQSTIASLVVLDERDVDRAVSCSAVWHVMNRNLSRPFVVGLFLIDLILHVTLMLAVREDVFPRTESIGSALGYVPTQVVLLICSFFLIRKIVEAISLFLLSISIFRSYILNLWTILDIIALGMTVAAVSYGKANPTLYRNGFNALVVGLLWIRVLGFLKVSNKQMATFIMAVTNILVDLKYFAIVLFTVVFMFGDMLSIAISTKDNGDFCRNADSADDTLLDFCSPDSMQAYLRVYALLLGDFELDNYKETQGMTTLFFLFTIIGVIILLNVLIAVTDDSYERSKIRGDHLFGRARVTFVAQNEALESFLRPGTTPMDQSQMDSTRKIFIRGCYAARWIVLASLIGTTINAEYFLCRRAWIAATTSNIIFYVASSILLALVLSMGLWIMCAFALEELIHSIAPRPIICVFDFFNNISKWMVKVSAGFIFGVQTVKVGKTEKDDSREEWSGRINYTQVMMQKALEQNRKDIVNEMQAMEKRLDEKHGLMQEERD